MTRVLSTEASLRSLNFPDRFIRHRGFLGFVEPIMTSSTEPRAPSDATLTIVQGLADPNLVSFMCVYDDESGHGVVAYWRHSFFRMRIDRRPPAGEERRQFDADATFVWQPGLSDVSASSFASYNFSRYFIRHRNFELYLELLGAPDDYAFSWDATFTIVQPLAPESAAGL